MDAGPILFQAREPIGPDETASDLYDRLAEVGAEALVEALALMEAGGLEEVEQDHSRATYAPKLDREHARVDWERPAELVARWIRGMDAVPGAWSLLEGVPVKLFRPRVAGGVDESAPGDVLEADPRTGLLVAAGRGAVRIGEVQPPGKRRMGAEEWIRGRGAHVGQRFE
jgi:methionyl-tRNA formyltransferase